MAENFSNLTRGINLNAQEAEWTPDKKNEEKFTQKYIIFKLLKTKDKHRKSWKQQERNNTLPPGRKYFEHQHISDQKSWTSKESIIFFKCWKKRIPFRAFCVQWKYPSEMNRKLRYSSNKQTNKKNLSPANLL